MKSIAQLNYSLYCVFVVVGELKQRIAELTNIPMCRQSLRGLTWLECRQLINSKKLRELNVSNENDIIVADVANDGGGAMDDDGIELLNTEYLLNILNEKDSVTYPLRFRGTQALLEIKSSIYTITNIAVRHQQWIGWPPDVDNTTLLGLTGIPLEHNLIVRSIEPTRNPNSHRFGTTSGRAVASGNNDTIEIDSDSSIDEFEDASDFNGDDDLFNSPPANNRMKYLSEFYLVLLKCCLLITGTE